MTRRVSRRTVLKAAAGALLAGPLAALARQTRAAYPRATAEQPNILLVTIDALRADHLSSYGYRQRTSPNIDQLAREGVQFLNAVSTAPWTFPAFSAIHTSMYPTELGISTHNALLPQIYGQRLDPARETLAERLAAQGYRTQAFVTNPWLFPEFGFSQGFQGYTVVDRQRAYDYDAILQATLAGRLAGQAPPAEAALRQLYEALMGPAGQPVWDVRGDRVMDSALNWLEGHRSERFFLWIHCIDPHYPFAPPASYRPAVPGVNAERLEYLASYNEEDIYTGRARLRPADHKALVGLYDGEIRFVDEQVGRLLRQLDDWGLRETTFLALTADHGDEFWDHGGYQHGHTLYNELLHIPLILRGPGLPARQVADVVRHVDLAPTLTAVAGSPFHADAHGLSLLDLLRAPGEPRLAFSEALFLTSEKKAIRSGSQKLIYDRFGGGSELYHLDADPGEHADLSEQAPDQVFALKRQLETWMAANDEKYAALPRTAVTGGDSALIEALRAGGY
ncbi:MAG: sulfatase [Anaerolineales bacterium]|nr:sulfatase [Anaerolineales bacterium]